MTQFDSPLILHLTRSERVMLRKIARESDPIAATRAHALLRIANGERRATIARESGVSHVTLFTWLSQFSQRRQRGDSVRAALAANTARVVGGHGPLLRLLLQANRAAKDWTIVEIQAFYRQHGIEIATGTAWNYKHALTEDATYPPRPPPRSNLAAAARQRGLLPNTVYARMRAGWDHERALSTPLLPGGRPKKRHDVPPTREEQTMKPKGTITAEYTVPGQPPVYWLYSGEKMIAGVFLISDDNRELLSNPQAYRYVGDLFSTIENETEEPTEDFYVETDDWKRWTRSGCPTT